MIPQTPPRMIRSEDGVTLSGGDRAFNYYDRKVGTIIPDSFDREGWFTFDHEDGTSTCLNGSRVCSVDFARRKGWID